MKNFSERHIPTVYRAFQDAWSENKLQYYEIYEKKACSFVPNLLPESAVQLPAGEVLELLRGRYGRGLELALDARYCDPQRNSGRWPAALRSPVQGVQDGRWLKTANLVGINVRTVGTFWNVVKYALTLPAAQGALHLLPIWEPGVVGSLYGMSSWHINPEFFSAELAAARPHLDTVEKQLKATVNLLHLMGRTVGMDVIPHTDRFSEMVLAFPEHFEWLQREDLIIVDHTEDLHREVQRVIWDFLQAQGPAVAQAWLPQNSGQFFSQKTPEVTRLRLLFGEPRNPAGRRERRLALIRHLYGYGFEPVPATMAPPYRGLAVDGSESARKVDENGLVWRDYVITRPTPMSRVFGPLTRYKLYERKNRNRDWEIDFSRPRPAVWQYVCEHYAAVQRSYGFDFMRGDMSHVQMRPQGVPPQPDAYYDLLGAVKDFIRKENNAPYFGYFAETFLAPPNVLAYGDEVDHLEASRADATLGDLQSLVVGSPEFLHTLRYYDDLRRTRTVAPSITVITADKDDPRFDHYYLAGNELRLFLALFLTHLPSYMALGFETRDLHPQPAPNEHYSKLYVFQEREGPKATRGPYVWGKNGALYHHLTRMRLFLESIWADVRDLPVRWLLPPHLAPHSRILAWTADIPAPRLVFVANCDLENPARNYTIPGRLWPPGTEMEWVFSTREREAGTWIRPQNTGNYVIPLLRPGEGQVYRCADTASPLFKKNSVNP